MNEDFINIFLSGALNYFKHIPNADTEVGVPYLIENKEPVSYDITGVIGISGVNKGYVSFTAPRVFLSHLLKLQGIDNVSTDNLLDLAGEIANTISGNVRVQLGKSFQISVPEVIEGKAAKNMYLSDTSRSYAIPIKWKSYAPLIIISMKNTEK